MAWKDISIKKKFGWATVGLITLAAMAAFAGLIHPPYQNSEKPKKPTRSKDLTTVATHLQGINKRPDPEHTIFYDPATSETAKQRAETRYHRDTVTIEAGGKKYKAYLALIDNAPHGLDQGDMLQVATTYKGKDASGKPVVKVNLFSDASVDGLTLGNVPQTYRTGTSFGIRDKDRFSHGIAEMKDGKLTLEGRTRTPKFTYSTSDEPPKEDVQSFYDQIIEKVAAKYAKK